MNIIEQLGVNHTYIYQRFIFIFALIILSQFVFKDFLKLIDDRDEKTKGSETAAVEVQKRAADLSARYESRAREVSGEIKTIFDSYREDAGAEYQNIVGKAKIESQKIIEETRMKVSVEVAEAAKKLQQEVPQIAQTMVQKLLSKSGRA